MDFALFYGFTFINITILKKKTKGTIWQILSEYLQKIDIVINNEYDIEIKYNIRELLKEKKGVKFKIKSLKNTFIFWIFFIIMYTPIICICVFIFFIIALN